MRQSPPAPHRSLPVQTLRPDIVVVGGGVPGVCFAVSAARAGSKVVLVQDRPVLGGNASSEVRLWMLGATAHGYNNNRWARESGVMNEIMMTNMYRNPGGNAYVFDNVLFDLVLAEPNLSVLLNTSVFAVEKSDADTISAVRGFNSQNETFYDLQAPCFCDASGDGVVGFLAGGAFRVGAESREEFGEPFAPSQAFGELLGHSIYFYSKDAGRPMPFIAPSYALMEVEKAIPRYRDFKAGQDGAKLWWIEFGGRLDTVFDTEKIKWELWRVAYGVWNYIKNSGKFPEAANLTLEWVGTIPGKRESRRFEGDYMLRQSDVVKQQPHEDDVAFGGWALDLHPADGVYSELAGCTHYYGKGPYPVPYRAMYSRNLNNLFLAGRILSSSHVSFGSLRVITTLGYCAQAAGTAAALCVQKRLRPRDLSQGENLRLLRRTLLRNGQHIRGHRHADPEDLALASSASASSEFVLSRLPADGDWISLRQSTAQMIPLAGGPIPSFTVRVRARKKTVLKTCVMLSLDPQNHTPEQVLVEAEEDLALNEERAVTISGAKPLPEAQYVYFALRANEDVEVLCSRQRVTGLLTLFHHFTQRDGDITGNHTRARDIGMDEFDLWSPRRRPEGQNLAFQLSHPVIAYKAAQVLNGVQRPTNLVNAWAADPSDTRPSLTLTWPTAQEIKHLVIDFDPDWDHPMESVHWWHSEQLMPFTVRDFQLEAADGTIFKEVTGNYLARHETRLERPISTSQLVIRITGMNGPCPASIFGVSAYA